MYGVVLPFPTRRAVAHGKRAAANKALEDCPGASSSPCIGFLQPRKISDAMHSDDMSDVPQALQSAVREEMKLEPKDFDFDDSCFSVHFEYRLTAVIAELPDCPHDYELVSTWIGRVQDSRVLDGKGEQKTVPAFIREYIHLDGKAAGGEGVQSKDGDEHEALPGRQSTAMAELVAYNEAFQDGYFLAPNRLSSYGWPTLSVRQFLAHSRKYHLLALYERQDNDRLLTSPPAHAQDAAEFQEVERYVVPCCLKLPYTDSTPAT